MVRRPFHSGSVTTGGVSPHASLALGAGDRANEGLDSWLARRSDADSPLFDAKTTTAPCVPALRDAVNQWRTDDYPGATATTRRLLNHWFLTDHRLAGRPALRLPLLPAARHRNADLPLRSRQGAAGRRRCIETFAGRPDLKLLAIRRLRPLLRQDGHRQRQDEGDGAGHRLAVFQRRGRGARRLRQDVPGHRAQRHRLRAAPDRLRRRPHLRRTTRSSPKNCASSGISSATCAAKASGPGRWARCT